MNSIKISNNFKKHVDFTNEELDLFFQLARREVVDKNKYVTVAEQDDAYLMHIESGCLMTFVNDVANQKHVLQFGVAHWWTGDLESMFKNQKSTHYIKAVERTILYKLDNANYNKLINANIKYERYFRILFQNSLVSHQKRIIRNISFSAEERYRAFVLQFPNIESLVAQKYVASYLGITPEFFSKLKKQLAEKEKR